MTISQNPLPLPPIEHLPPELQLLIFQVLDIPSLRSLIHSSPTYHATYLAYRQRILYQILLNDLLPRGLFLAYAVEKANLLKQDQENTLERRTLFLSNFLDHYQRSIPKQWFKNLDLRTTISLLHRHSMMQRVATDCFSQTILLNPIDQEPISHPPSWSEAHRVYRGLYLFELYSVLCNSPELYPSTENLGFLTALQTWESEEVLCVYEYLIGCYYRMIRRCGVSTNWWEDGDDKIEYLISLGIGFFSRMLTSTVESQAKLLFENRWARQRLFTDIRGLEYRLSGIEGHTHITTGTTHSDHEEVDAPNAALVWSQMVSCAYEMCGLRSWGYAFWDVKRLEAYDVMIEYPWDLSHEAIARFDRRRVGSRVARYAWPRFPRYV